MFMLNTISESESDSRYLLVFDFNYYSIHSIFEMYYYCSIQPCVQQKKLLCLRTAMSANEYNK